VKDLGLSRLVATRTVVLLTLLIRECPTPVRESMLGNVH
jgi:hypothetical protein